MFAFVVVVALLAALAAWLIWRSIAAAESQGAESTLVASTMPPRSPREAVTDLPGPGAEHAVPEPATRPDEHAQWDEVHGAWVVWHPVLARWVPWEDGVASCPAPDGAPTHHGTAAPAAPPRADGPDDGTG